MLISTTSDITHTAVDHRYVIWFDIDNTLYSRNCNVSQAMHDRILAYILALGWADDEASASALQGQYYARYGLTVRGLVLHRHIDPMDFDRKCDGSLPLEEMIRPNPSLRKLFQDIDRSKARVWALTNAYIQHAQRVLRILNLEDQIEGIVYSDYLDPHFACKPEPEFYHKAMRQANLSDSSKCLFIDDDRKNVDAAKKMGWGCVHFYEHESESVEGGPPSGIGTGEGCDDDIGMTVIHDLERLREVWSHVFTPEES